jgi:tRNA-dihydrouridine synthase B
MYRPGVDLSAIAAVKAAVSIPVIGNGDIMSVEDALRMKRETGCDGLMIARGAMGNPWLFAEIRALLEGREFIPPTLEERIETALSQMAQMIEEKGERVGFAESKKQMAWYIHGVTGAAEARGRLMTAVSADEVADVMRGLIR